MTKQPEALRLADKLNYQVDFGSYDWERVEPMMAKAAAELRRLHDLLGKANALCRIRDDRIKELETEIKTEQVLSFRSQVAELEAEIEVLRADAERLDWCIDILFHSQPGDCYLIIDAGCGCCGYGKQFNEDISGRNAIDAARSKT